MAYCLLTWVIGVLMDLPLFFGMFLMINQLLNCAEKKSKKHQILFPSPGLEYNSNLSSINAWDKGDGTKKKTAFKIEGFTPKNNLQF